MYAYPLSPRVIEQTRINRSRTAQGQLCLTQKNHVSTRERTNVSRPSSDFLLEFYSSGAFHSFVWCWEVSAARVCVFMLQVFLLSKKCARIFRVECVKNVSVVIFVLSSKRLFLNLELPWSPERVVNSLWLSLKHIIEL